MKTVLDYYFWINSDWAYFGHPRLESLVERFDLQVNFLPVDIDSVLANTGGIPLGQRNQARQDYRLAELRRFSAILNMPINVAPKYDHDNARKASLFVVAAQLRDACSIKLIQKIMQGLWVEELDIEDEQVLIGTADALGLDGKEILEASHSDEVFSKYRENTRSAIMRGAFGSPFYFLEGEPFWGQDRLELLERSLKSRKQLF